MGSRAIPSPEDIEIKAIPELQSEPTSAPLPGMGQFDLPKPEFERWVFEFRSGRAILRKKVDLMGLIALMLSNVCIKQMFDSCQLRYTE